MVSIVRGRVCRSLLVLLLTLPFGCSAREYRLFEATRDPVIAVLCQMTRELVLLDPEDLSVVRRIPLKSQSLDLDTDGRKLLTAQTGGHGSEMGKEYGCVDLDAGTVHYTSLTSIDIQTVSVADDGWYMLTAGLVNERGQWLHRVDADGNIEDLQLPPGICGSTSVRDRVWVWHFWDDETGNPSDEYMIYGPTGRPEVISSQLTMTVGVCGFDDEVIAFGVDGANAQLVRHDARTGRVLKIATTDGFEVGPSYAWSAGRYLAIADGPSEDYYQSTRLLLIDPQTLEVVRVVESLKGVSAVSAGPKGNLIVCEGDGSVSLVDPNTARRFVTAKIGDPRGDLVDVAYVP
ncbi:MAG: hypothetical protein KJ747_07710 [Actinobacteria bacterium]|nr:hypothetical protein [Actinomycetota bacterium]MCG2808083.1 hypothetical protein [Coriobacteriia bacterium]